MINHQKAYILGLLTGGGTISKDTFIIKLPFKKWGMKLENANKIQIDILTKICQKFQTEYQFSVTYELGNGIWIIKPIGNPNTNLLFNDLTNLGLPTNGFLLNNVDLTTARNILKGISVESFLSGIFDTRASLTPSHRRFTSKAPVVSIEIPGSTKNFKFVVQFCSWLTSLGTITDQILFNHPCQHAAADPNYKGWKKGFKIRFLVKSFLAKYSFALQAKAFDIEKLETLQEKKQQQPCIERKIRKPSPVTIHTDINSKSLPDKVRNKLFFHYFHFCSAFECPYAPRTEIEKIVMNYKNYIFVLPRLEKGSIIDIKNKYASIKAKYFPSKIIIDSELLLKNILEDETLKKYLEIEQGIAYLFSEKLNGKRHVGSKNKIIKSNLHKKVTISYPQDEILYPIVISNIINNRAFIVSALSGLNKELIDKNVEVTNLKVELA